MVLHIGRADEHHPDLGSRENALELGRSMDLKSSVITKSLVDLRQILCSDKVQPLQAGELLLGEQRWDQGAQGPISDTDDSELDRNLMNVILSVLFHQLAWKEQGVLSSVPDVS